MAMKKFDVTMLALMLLVMLSGCQGNKGKGNATDVDSTSVTEQQVDSTVYGVCGEGTAMSTLELITDGGDTLNYMYGESTEDVVKGGLLVGDRLAVMGHLDADSVMTATNIINLTTLLGKWTSIDKNFEIEEGGIVKSNVKAESKSWTSWKIFNGNLLLNRDTFKINQLGADSLYLENNNGIYAFKRLK